ncbi:hypothetical protein SAMN05216251_12676 [Actinacidiphila alni]|uniref:Uncharacterized protein n=1 Tax=Actinacidiphila alni TaxID=380248 RepID=A0A1I2L870_9ACTN|nr:hypothetical protein [Actinacidiphila alni]SFF73421.1 hypothetical protein SAMN05216251_12676 [Actinacidiphila alni]
MQQGMQPQFPYGQRPAFGPGPAAPRALARGARIAGALICGVLLAVEIAWAVRDIRDVGFHDVLRSWLGLDLPGREHSLLATGTIDALLIVILAGALTRARRPGAGWAFVAAGVFASGYRLPGLWIFQSDWTDGAPLHSRALATAVAFTLGGIALVVIGLAGRRPVDPGAAPVPSRRGAAVAAGVLLVLIAVQEIGWEIFYVQKYTTDNGFPGHLYEHLLTGETTISSLLAAPSAYAGWLGALIALAAAVAAFAKSPAARPLGLAFALSEVVLAIVGLDVWHTEKILFKFDHLPTYLKAQQIFLVVELLLGIVILVLLAVPGGEAAPRPVAAGWGPPRQGFGAPPAPGGWGTPPQSPPLSPYTQSPPAPPMSQAPRLPQQPPAGGGFGPPPPLPPDFPPGDRPGGS